MASKAVLAIIVAGALLHTSRAHDTKQPNFVLIMTDDQGDLLDDTSPHVMPELNRLLIDQGQRFVNYYSPTPICCPARVSLLRGQYTHNHNYTDVLGPDTGGVAGYPKFKELHVDDSYLPVWLQSLGYTTFYTGKFIVDYTVKNYANKPKGWTDIDALVTPFLFQYYDPAFSRNGQPPTHFPGRYSTDVVGDKGIAQIRTAAASGHPFYVQISTIAPHFSSGGPLSGDGSGNSAGNETVPRYPPLPAPRHWDLFTNLSLPKPLATFNEPDVSDKPVWVRSLPKLTRANVTYLEEVWRNRLRSLRAVDELIARVVATLEDLDLLDNTYVLFTSDNGYHLGAHRRGSGKLSAYEEDIRVPFVIRGPGLAAGEKVLHQASHVDLAPTILALAGAQAPPEVDGHPLPLVPDASAKTQLPSTYPASSPGTRHPSRAQLPLVMFNDDWDEYFYDRPTNPDWTWKAIRVLDASSVPDEPIPATARRHWPLQRGYKYAVLCQENARELYDLRVDSDESENLLDAQDAEASHADGVDSVTSKKHLKRLSRRLDVLLQVLQTCWGTSCRTPFSVIHNDSDTKVVELWDALDPKYDAVYDKVPLFRFKSCQRYQDYSNEVNYFKPILGTFPRGPDGKSLARVNITWANGTAVGKAHATSVPSLARQFFADVEADAVPVSEELQRLSVDELYGRVAQDVGRRLLYA